MVAAVLPSLSLKGVLVEVTWNRCSIPFAKNGCTLLVTVVLDGRSAGLVDCSWFRTNAKSFNKSFYTFKGTG